MQENRKTTTTCRCCGHKFYLDNVCPVCGFPFFMVFEPDDLEVKEDVRKYREAHAHQIKYKVGVIFNKPSVWKDDRLEVGEEAYLELAVVNELTKEFSWNSGMEFASFGCGEKVTLRVYFENLDGSKEEQEVSINLPLVRGVTWKAAVCLSEDRKGVEFAVGVPECFTQTGIVRFRDC